MNDLGLDAISLSLGAATPVATIPRPVAEPVKDLTPAEAPEIDDDYQEARAIMKELISQAMEYVPEVMELAKQAQSDKMVNAAANLLNAAANLNISLSKLSKEIKTKKEVKGTAVAPTGEAAPQGNTTNVFVGSTEDFLDMLAERIKNKDKPVIEGECTDVTTQ